MTIEHNRYLSDAGTLILAERQRQVTQEGYSAEHDDRHGPAELMAAAMAYYLGDPAAWPWRAVEFKPQSYKRNLVRAGALMLAARDCAMRLGRGGDMAAADLLADDIAIRLDAVLMTGPRDRRQAEVEHFCVRAFGVDHATGLPQRGIRLLEEAVELAQAAGCDGAMAHQLVDFVFARPVGQIGQEIGGVSITLLALAAAAGLSADAEEQRELERILAKPIEHFTARNKEKNAAGFDALKTAESGA